MILRRGCIFLLFLVYVDFSTSSTKVYYVINNVGTSRLIDKPPELKYKDAIENKQKHHHQIDTQKHKAISDDYENHYQLDKSLIKNCKNLGQLCLKLVKRGQLRKGEDSSEDIEVCKPGHNGHDLCRPEPNYPAWLTTTPAPSTTEFPPAFDPDFQESSYEYTGTDYVPYAEDLTRLKEGPKNRKFSLDYLDFAALMRANNEQDKKPLKSKSYEYLNPTEILLELLATKSYKNKNQIEHEIEAMSKYLRDGTIISDSVSQSVDEVKDESESSGSGERKPRFKRPKRFEVISKKKKRQEVQKSSESSSESQSEKENPGKGQMRESDESASEEKIKEKSKAKGKGKGKKKEREKEREKEKKKVKNDKNIKQHNIKKKIINKFSSEQLESHPVSEEKVIKPKFKKVRVPNKPDTYIQAHGRQFKEGKDFRKRLPSFMPKRYHWAEEDFNRLGYFWFNGVQGLNPGPVRIMY